MSPILRGALLISILCAGGCGPDATGSAAREENRILMERVDLLTEDAKRAADEARAAERSLQTVRAEAVRKEKEAQAERESLKKKTDEAVKALEDYKTKYRVTYRSKAAGRKMERLDSGTDGVFEEVQILTLTPGELRFHHRNGVATLALGQLNADLRETLAYDPEEAVAWMKEQQEKQAASGVEAAAERTLAAATGTKSKKSPASGPKGRYQTNLNFLYARARDLQADANACPVHKRYQLAVWAREAAGLKQKLAALP